MDQKNLLIPPIAPFKPPPTPPPEIFWVKVGKALPTIFLSAFSGFTCSKNDVSISGLKCFSASPCIFTLWFAISSLNSFSLFLRISLFAKSGN